MINVFGRSYSFVREFESSMVPGPHNPNFQSCRLPERRSPRITKYLSPKIPEIQSSRFRRCFQFQLRQASSSPLTYNLMHPINLHSDHTSRRTNHRSGLDGCFVGNRLNHCAAVVALINVIIFVTDNGPEGARHVRI